MKKIIVIVLTLSAFYVAAFDSADKAGEKAANTMTARHAMLAGL